SRHEMIIAADGADKRHSRHETALHLLNQCARRTGKTSSGCAENRRRTSRRGVKTPGFGPCCRFSCQKKYSFEPSRHSHRKMAFTRTDLKLKSGLPKVNGCAGPSPSGSTVYCPVVSTEICPVSMPYRENENVFGSASSLKSQ